MIGSKNLSPQDLDKIESSVLVEELRKAKEELFNCASSRLPAS